ncbi:MAG TPA: hypothetical protein VK133_02895 [Amoebophilaceae bacterium]|jgi:hypothetical protein|nr:hypothetical protein [Amoebophilaceae bacterium]
MKTIKKNNFLYTFTKTFFLASTLCTFPAHADEGNTEKESKEALAKEIQELKKKLKEERSINIIIQNKNDVKSDSNSEIPTSLPVTTKKPNSKFKLGGMFFGSTTIQELDSNEPLVERGVEGGFSIFFEYKLANWFGLRSGIVGSNSSFQSTDLSTILTIRHVSVPLTACFYPGKDRQWRLFVGPRFGSSMNVELQTLGWITKEAKEKLEKKLFVFGDFGFDHESKKGFIIGLDGLGICLGWNVAALF